MGWTGAYGCKCPKCKTDEEDHTSYLDRFDTGPLYFSCTNCGLRLKTDEENMRAVEKSYIDKNIIGKMSVDLEDSCKDGCKDGFDKSIPDQKILKFLNNRIEL